MKLISQWWNPRDEERLAELEFCKQKNESIFGECVYLDGSQGSLTFKRLFSEAKDGELCVVANTDVWFDESVRLLEGLCEEKVFVALTRWSNESSPYMAGWTLPSGDDFLFFSGSQDAWAFVGCEAVRQSVELPLGIVGCDQAVAAWAATAGLFVVDPALSVKCWHKHEKREGEAGGGRWAKGLYGYPQLTTMDVTGLVAAHEWNGDGKQEWSLIRCQR